jgi:hypothetical protein
MSGFIEALSQQGVGGFADFGVKGSQNHPFLRMNLAFAWESTSSETRSIHHNHSNPSSEKAQVSHDSLTPAIPSNTLARRIKGTSVVLMSLMVLGAIDGFVGARGRSLTTTPDSTPSLEFQSPMESLNSLVVRGAAVLVSDR